MSQLIKQPSAWIPIAMSLIVLAFWFFSIARCGVPIRETDEGTAAHLFQIWLVLEVLTVAFFAIKWLPQRPKQTLSILAVQIITTLAACAPIFFFKL